MAQIFYLEGEADCKTESSNLIPKEMTSFNSVKKIKPKGAFENSGGCIVWYNKNIYWVCLQFLA